ncbi:MAG: HDOD domain-containing protein [Acidobacteriota bacterium]
MSNLKVVQLKRRIQGCRTLPTLPGIALQLLQHCREGEIDLRKTAEVMGRDPALCAKVLKFVNSPLYGLRREVTTLSHAVSLLGFNSIRTLALSFSLVRGLRRHDRHGFDFDRFWRRSILSGAAARAFGVFEGAAIREELFLLGLLQDIGMLALQAVLPGSYVQILDQSKGDHERLQELEEVELGVDHSEVSAWLAEMWQLPQVFPITLRCSHDIARSGVPEDLTPTIRYVALSGYLADVWLSGDKELAYQRARDCAGSVLGMGSEAFRSVFSLVNDFMPSLSALFEVGAEDTETITQILEDAKEQLVSINLETVTQFRRIKVEANDLVSENRRLKEISARDGLTGVYNRAHLDASLVEEFDRACLRQEPLSLIFLDVDHLKRINDTYGHQAGDRVLVCIAHLVAGIVRQFDMVTRYGGDEFMLVLPEADSVGAAMVADRIRASVASRQFDIGSHQPIRVTISAGFATHSLDQPFEDVEALGHAADLALYAAKRAGRNRSLPWTELPTPELKARDG